MGRRGRPTTDICLSGAERETLERWARRPKSAQALAQRCRIVLLVAEGRTIREVAAELSCNLRGTFIPIGDVNRKKVPLTDG